MLSRWNIYKNSDTVEAKFLKTKCNWHDVNSECCGQIFNYNRRAVFDIIPRWPRSYGLGVTSSDSALLCNYFVERPLLADLQHQVFRRFQAAFRPRPSAAYTVGFRQFLAFTVKMDLDPPYGEIVVILYLEYLAQRGLKTNSIRNQVSILKHFLHYFVGPLLH